MTEDPVEAVIVAGGKGKRMGYLTGSIPKPMLKIAGKPILEHQINFLRCNGIKKVFILVGHLGYVIKDYFDNGRNFDVNIEYFLEDEPLGTSGCMKVLEGKIKNDFLVLYGDLMLDINLDDFVAFHRTKGGAGTLVSHPNDHPYDSDLVIVDDHCKIIGILANDRKPKYYSNLVSAAVYMLSPAVFNYIPKDVPSDFVRNTFPEMLKCSERLYSYKTAEYVKDMGTVDRLGKVSKDFLSGKICRLSKKFKRPAVFMDRDGTLIKKVTLLHKVEDLELFPFSASAIKKINDSDFLVILITNQPVVARNLCDILAIKEIHNKLETLLGEKSAYLNDIYFCPHHPDRGYSEENVEFKMECNCRKPKTGMLRHAAEKYNIDMELSWVIGDTTTDIQTGINAGIQTILVRTGEGGKDKKYQTIPDFTFDNIEDALDFILKDKQKYDLYVKEIVNKVENDKNCDPFIICVSGLARAGKSIFVKLLLQAMQKRGITTQSLSLDNWLVGITERTDYMTMRQRYKYNEIEKDIAKLINQEKILLRRYDPYSRKIVSEGYFSLDGSRCLIVDGIPALDINWLRDIANIKIYIEIYEGTRKERFFSFYKWKDLSDEMVEHLYYKRLVDELPFVEETKKYADVVIRRNGY